MRYATTRYGLEISHLAYADDVIVFTQARKESLQEFVDCLSHYAAVSGQKINMEKSHFFVDSKHATWAAGIEATGGFQQGSFPFTYLGVPIFKGRKKTDMFLFLREKISERIHSWSHKFLSFGGRLALIKSTLGAIPLHVFQVLEPTKAAMKQMEALIAKYFWGSSQEKRATHWINWEQMCHPFEEGGLGIRRFKEMVEAFGMKLWVRFREQSSLWARFMMSKYCHNVAPSKAPFSGKQSIAWKRMARAGRKIHKHIVWSVGKGEIDFWEDIWWSDRPLSEMCNPGVATPRKKVKDFWENGNWNARLLQGMLIPLGVPTEVFEEIVKIPIDSSGRDTLRWSCSAHGNFTTSSAWELCRHRHPHATIFTLIWNKCVLPSISIFVWRLLANRVPVDVKMQWRKVSLASKCRCCDTPGVESREHLFIRGEVAAEVWGRVASWFPKLPRWNEGVSDLETRIRFWHRRICNADMVHVSSIIPCLVLWFIWSERNSHIHRGTKMRAEVVFNRVVRYLQQLISAGSLGKEDWNGCEGLESFNTSVWKEKPRKTIKLVRWIPPDRNWIKLNTKGTWRQTEAGVGCIIRDSGCNLIRGITASGPASSGLEAELQALSLGLDLAGEQGKPTWIEMDSVEVVSMIQANKHGPANLRHCLTNIRNKMRCMTSKISLCDRVGNRTAEFLARRGPSEGNQQRFDHNTAPSMLKALVRMEQLNLPSFNFRYSN